MEHEKYALPPNITIKIDGGFVVPSWVGVLAGVVVLCSTLSLLLAVLLAGPRLGELAQRFSELAREVRILELHTEDVESVLKSKGIATTQDFPGWGSDSGPGHRAKPEKGR